MEFENVLEDHFRNIRSVRHEKISKNKVSEQLPVRTSLTLHIEANVKVDSPQNQLKIKSERRCSENDFCKSLTIVQYKINSFTLQLFQMIPDSFLVVPQYELLLSLLSFSAN